MRCLAYLSLCLLMGCAPVAYKNMRPAAGDATCVQQFAPAISRALYKTSVAITGNYITGILLIKQMPDSTTRMLFTNEAGFTFFDFSFTPAGAFQVHSIIKKMDKKAVKKTLQKDFELLFSTAPYKHMQPVQHAHQNKEEKYFAYINGSDYFYYITNKACTQLIRRERGSATRKVLEAFSSPLQNGVPDSVAIHHTNFNFDIQLKRIYDNAD